LTATPPHWGTPGDIADLRLSKVLGYVGHLKAPAMSQSLSGNGTARALDGGATAAVAAATWEVFTKVADNEGDIRWELARMEGAKHPWDDAKWANSGVWQTKTVRSKARIDTGPFGLDEFSAEFEITFRYNGHSVGYVDIQHVDDSDAPFWGMSVKAVIMPDPNTYNVANQSNVAKVEVTLNYTFEHSIRDNDVQITVVELFGTGHVNKRSRWTT
jgi:hypothetical protein